MSRPLSKREIEEVKKKDDLKRSAEVFSDFIQAFEETDSASKKFTTFVRGGAVVPGKGEIPHSHGDNLYIPKPKSQSSSSHSESTEDSSRPAEATASSSASKSVLVKKQKEKKKSNLEIFKDELRQIQEEREERKRLKEQITSIETKLGTSVKLPPSSSSYSAFLQDDNRVFDGTYDLSGDSSSTNLYMGNIAPGVTEDQICQTFGKYGPIASVKIMYPRGEEKSESRSGRNTLCGFVAFMCRSDAERALYHLRGKEVYGCEMRLGWGKIVPIPTFPIYVPPRLAELLEAPPFSGLPFNAQPDSDQDWDRLPKEGEAALSVADTMDILSRSTVRVVQPSERNLLHTIHRTIEFIVREGSMFEAMLMQREKGNALYRFLFDNYCNEHVYFRWKLFSVLQGETSTQWRLKEFRMFEGGPLWKPPPINPYGAGMKEELVERGDDVYVKETQRGRRTNASSTHKEHPVSSGKAGLAETDRVRLNEMLTDLTPSRDSVADAMIFCIDHADVADDIISAIVTALQIEADSPLKKVAKIYLISDILHNCSGVHVQNAWYYRNGFEQKFAFIFTQLRQSYRSIEGRLKAEQYKQRVMNCFRAWEDWALYPPKYLIKLQNIFLGLEAGEASEENLFDGKPLLETQSAPSLPLPLPAPTVEEADVDGVPMDEDVDGVPMEETDTSSLDSKAAPVAFAPSRWESIDPEQVKAQAITTSKWDQLEGTNPHGSSDSPEETAKSQAKKLDDHVREKLREIEMRVLKYQDDVETGRRSRHVGESLREQVEKYRKQLLGSSTKPPTSSSSSSSARTKEVVESRRPAKRSRSRSKSRDAKPSTSSSRSSADRRTLSTAAASSSSSSSSRDRRRSRSRERRH